jgi:hypothetical protein
MSSERLYTPAEVTAREAASAEAMREACAADVDCGCAARDDVLARYSTDGHKRASYLCSFGDACCALQAVAIRALPIPHASALAHSDDRAVVQFASAMRAKMAAARDKGRSGWDDPEQCKTSFLADLLLGHCAKANEGNFVDIANLAMMLHMRGATNEAASALARALADAEKRGMERAAEIAKMAWPRAHTYASENADLYRAQDHAVSRVITAIRNAAAQESEG